MTELPGDLAEYLRTLELDDRGLAYLGVDQDGRLTEAGGQLQSYGLENIRAGHAIDGDHIDCVRGVLPARGRGLILPLVELRPGCVATIHVLPATSGSDERGSWIVFLDGGSERERQRIRQQTANESALKQKIETRRREGAEGQADIPGDGALFPELFSLLDIAALEYRGDGVFDLLGSPPRVSAFFPEVTVGCRCLRLTVRFPFVDHFLIDAREFWDDRRRDRLRSGTWVEIDAAQNEYYLEATAVLIDGRRLVLLDAASARYDERHAVIQRAREGKLRLDRVISEQGLKAKELCEARDELEQRVAERTAELSAANEQLRREVAQRRQATEKLLAYQAKLRSLALELTMAEERERRRIASDLHDHIGQILAIGKIKIGSVRELLVDAAPDQVEEIYDLLGEAIQYTRTLTFELGSPVLYEFGLEAALESLVRQFHEQHRIEATFQDDRQPKLLADDVRVILFQAVRELLFNVTKHAQASQVQVSCERKSNQVRIRVADDGIGFDPLNAGANVPRLHGFGLFSIRERLDYVGGRLEIDSAAEGGTRILLVAPLT